MIMRQVSKYQRNRQRQQPQQRRRSNQIPPYDNRSGQSQGGQRRQQAEYKDLNKELGRDGRGKAISAEERDFNLKDEEIMLSKEDLKHFERNNRQVEELSNSETNLDSTQKQKPSNKSADDDSDYDEFFEA